LIDEVRDALKTCPASPANSKETVRCRGDLDQLIGGDFGFCEINYAHEVRRRTEKADCNGSDESIYRFSLADVDPRTIAADRNVVSLRPGRPALRQTLAGQAGLGCAANVDERYEEVNTVPLDFSTSTIAQEAVAKLQAVATYCQGAPAR
jgi:hypothetical protein